MTDNRKFRNKKTPEEGYIPELDIVTDMSFDAIAKELGVTRQAVYNIYANAMRKLRRRYRHDR
jgi:DNA-directed RNA polymerase sigma subunit (sigma70/sigma32)